MYADIIEKFRNEGTKINYKIAKDGWFTLSVAKSDGVDGYLRYHRDGPGMLGFSMWWNNSNGIVNAERIAVLTSASLWSEMTGARFTELPAFSRAVAAAPPQPQPTPQPPSANGDAPPAAAVEPKQKDPSSGTGFFVSRDGHVVTNNHVVDGCSGAAIRTELAVLVPARVIARDPKNDLALLKAEGAHVQKVAPLRIGIRLGEQVAVFGFPHAQLLARSGSFTQGTVTALAGLGDDTSMLTMSAPVQAGNSGGPLLDRFGNVVGVVTAKLGLKMAIASGDLPQNINFAVKAAGLATFLESNGVSFEAGSPGDKAVDPADLADVAKALSVFIVCRPQ